jgi:hypothetical protein
VPADVGSCWHPQKGHCTGALHTTWVEAGADGRSCEPRATSASCTFVPELSPPSSERIALPAERYRRTKSSVRCRIEPESCHSCRHLPLPRPRNPSARVRILLGSGSEPEMRGSGSSVQLWRDRTRQPGALHDLRHPTFRAEYGKAPLFGSVRAKVEWLRSAAGSRGASVRSRGPTENWCQNWRQQPAEPELTTAQPAELQ